MIRSTALYFCISLFPLIGWSQAFPAKGQYPANPYPICGSYIFKQGAVTPGYNSPNMSVPKCVPFTDINPYYYSFNCYQSGSLNILITPNDPADNYDWILYDVSFVLVTDIFSTDTLAIAANRSGSPGPTGTKFGVPALSFCATLPSDNVSTFSPIPQLIQGHHYLLLVMHPGDTQSGYSLDLTGGSAVLNDPAVPDLLSVVVRCDQVTLTVGINKFIQCNTLAPDGSDFNIPGLTITKAVGLNCTPQFDMDYLELTLSDSIKPGNYTLFVKNGSDNNTLINDCGLSVPAGNKIDFTVPGVLPVLDSMVPPVCSPKTLQVFFKDPIQCSSLSPDGSDFAIEGYNAVTITSAAAKCVSGVSQEVDLTLSTPISSAGDYLLLLKNGSDGNTVSNACGFSAPPGAELPFTVKAIVSADFNYEIGYGCSVDTIHLNYTPADGVTQWQWKVDSNDPISLQNPTLYEQVFGSKIVEHIVSNAQCSDTVVKTIALDNVLQASIESPSEVCPKTDITFASKSIGNIVSWSWNFGDGSSSSLENPPAHLYPDSQAGINYPLSLIVKSDMGCLDTATRNIIKLQSCMVAVPNAFTPNGDGKNDYLYPLNAFTLRNLEFQVFNRYGQLVFETRDPSKKWDGTIRGQPQGFGTYVWVLSYTDSSGAKVTQKGSSVLIR